MLLHPFLFNRISYAADEKLIAEEKRKTKKKRKTKFINTPSLVFLPAVPAGQQAGKRKGQGLNPDTSGIFVDEFKKRSWVKRGDFVFKT